MKLCISKVCSLFSFSLYLKQMFWEYSCLFSRPKHSKNVSENVEMFHLYNRQFSLGVYFHNLVLWFWGRHFLLSNSLHQYFLCAIIFTNIIWAHGASLWNHQSDSNIHLFYCEKVKQLLQNIITRRKTLDNLLPFQFFFFLCAGLLFHFLCYTKSILCGITTSFF